MKKSTSPAVKQIDTLIRARFPLIAVTSHEERRVIEGLSKVAAEHGKALFTWAISHGLRHLVPTDGNQGDV